MPLRRIAARADLRLLEVFCTRRVLAALPLSAVLVGAVAGGQTAPPAKGKAIPSKAGTIQAPFSPLPPPPGSKSAGGKIPPTGTTPFPAPPTLPPAGPPLPPLPTLPRRVSLTGAVPPAMQAQIAPLDIDAAAIEGALPVLWRGTAYGADSLPGDSSSGGISRKLALLRKASGAHLARINPFAVPGIVLPGVDGVPVVRWDAIDAMLRGAAAHQEEVVFSLQPPPAWTESAWNALIALVLRRYRTNPPASILRWELRGDAGMAPARYAAFARQCRALYPSAPLGIYVASGDVGEGTRRVAQICAASRVPLDSVAWRLPPDAAGAAGAARQVRAALGAYPALKGTLLLPTLAVPRAQDDVSDVSSRLVSLCARLIEAAPAAPPNPLGGLLVEDDSLDNGGDSGGRISRNDGGENAANGDTALQVTAALTLLNRITGTRVAVRNGGAGIGCLASQNGTRTFALLWRATDARRAGSHAAQSTDAPVLVRLHHLTAGATGLRITRSATGEIASAPIAVHSSTASGDAANSSLPGSMTADIPAVGNYLPGELEVTTLLAPGEVCLLDIAPRDAPPPLLQTTLSVAGADLRGGDPFEVVLSARNLSANARAIDAVLTSSVPDVLPQANVRLTLGTLPAGGARSFRFTLRAPVVASSRTLTLGVQTDDARSLITLPILPALEAALEADRADVSAIGGTATLRARLINRGRAPLTARLRMGLGTPVEVTVAPGGRPQTVTLAVTPPLPAPGLYPVNVRVESANRTLSSLPAQIGVPFACPRVQTTPAIDGDLGEWTGDTPLGMGRAEQAHGKPWGGPSDISAYAYTRWDARYFYFACAVTDDVFIPPRSASQLEQGDSVFVALSADGNIVSLENGAGANAAGANKASGQDRSAARTAVFGMALMQNAKGGLEPTLVRLSPNGAGGRVTAQSVQDGRIAIRRDGSRVFYEAAIPWSRILVAAPQSGQTLGLSILVNDTDSAAGKGQNPRRGTMEWGGGLAGRIQPLLFPPLRLTK